MSNFDVIKHNNKIIKMWKHGVPFDDNTIMQYKNISQLPFILPYAAAMADSHLGKGGPVGAVLPTIGAVCPSLVGVDVGCGVMAVRTLLEADRGAWHNIPEDIAKIWKDEFLYEVTGKEELGGESRRNQYVPFSKHPGALSKNAEKHLGTLGTGNHFIELSEDEENRIWIVLHSGSRGFGNRIGTYFTNLAKQKCEQWFVQLPDKDLAYFPQGTDEYNDYLKALNLAQKYAWRNREIMMQRVWNAIHPTIFHGARPLLDGIVHCHHNYMAEETHFGKKVLLTRKGAVKADVNDFVIIPGAMGAKTFIAKGLGNPHSFKSCSHGAGRAMSRTEAKKRFSVADHVKFTEGLECHKGKEVLDETTLAYKDVEAVMAAQSDLVQPIHTLRALVCVKGLGE